MKKRKHDDAPICHPELVEGPPQSSKLPLTKRAASKA
jgi:hypothetical protein